MTTPRDQELRLEIDENQEVPDYRSLPVSRRTVLRRSVLGLTGIGLTAFLAACGDDEEEPAVEEEEVVEDEEVVEEETVEEEPAEEEEEDGL